MTFDEIPGARERIRSVLADLVKASGLSQLRFATVHDFSQHQVNAWLNEEGHTTPNFSNLEKIAALARIPWEWFLIGDDGLKTMNPEPRDPIILRVGRAYSIAVYQRTERGMAVYEIDERHTGIEELRIAATIARQVKDEQKT